MPTTRREEQKNRRKGIAEYAQKHGFGATVKHFGVSGSTVVKSFREHFGISMRFMSIERTLIIVAKLQEGWHPPTIAQEIGVSRQHVYCVRSQCLANGVKVPELNGGEGRTLLEIFAEEGNDG